MTLNSINIHIIKSLIIIYGRLAWERAAAYGIGNWLPPEPPVCLPQQPQSSLESAALLCLRCVFDFCVSFSPERILEAPQTGRACVLLAC